ncbi:hypothetical protein [Ferrimicrobium acidiphilum]|jgi:hypothetical protein|uniref:Uncharacterized protein n=1 Tax=Ferrimicrobium acidiphilum TaxID=121039 RepID=A0ABV3Y0R9_9ACTN
MSLHAIRSLHRRSSWGEADTQEVFVSFRVSSEDAGGAGCEAVLALEEQNPERHGAQLFHFYNWGGADNKAVRYLELSSAARLASAAGTTKGAVHCWSVDCLLDIRIGAQIRG